MIQVRTGDGKMRVTWEQYAIELAKVARCRSEDPYIKVGACALRHDNSIGGLGYNGPPPKVEIDWSNRDERRKRVIHAEINALRYVRPGECSLIAVTLLPCNDCLKTISSYGIKKVIYADVYERDKSSMSLAEEFGVKLIFDFRREGYDQICY
jgi:dCMP deaminase